jgi:cyanate lyase
MSIPTAPLDKTEVGRIVDRARVRHGLTWAQLAEAIGRPPVWTVAALLGRHPVPAAEAGTVAKLLELGDDVVEALQLQPTRVADRAATSDPTIYRFYEALNVYGPALKALIHEEFGDGIMSAINFKLSVARRPDPEGDRVVVTFDGKFLPYQW